jgi:hypothetical protein
LRLRAIASLGVAYVREHQESLMRSAWDQAGEVQRANRLLQHMQLARECSGVLYRASKQGFSDTAFLQMSGAVQKRLRVEHDEHTQTPRGHLRGTRLHLGAASNTFRRLARPRGPVAQRLGSDGTEADGFFNSLSSNNAADVTGVVQPPPAPDGAALLPVNTPGATDDADDVTIVVDDGRRIEEFLEDPLVNPPISVDGTPIREVIDTIIDRLVRQPVPYEGIDLSGLLDAMKAALDPEKTLPALAQSRVAVPGEERADPLAPVFVVPQFPQWMQHAVGDISQAMYVANLAALPAESIVILEQNTAFAAAFMVGLNHEMSRELQWRNYPLPSLGGTYFRRFWDRRSTNPNAATNSATEMPPIHTWDADTLDDTMPGVDKLVLVARGELFRRYPNAMITMTHLGEVEEVRHPEFSGTLQPDVTYFAFNLTEEEARNNSWYLAIQSPPGEPAFGFNEPAPGYEPIENIQDWNDLTWAEAGTEGSPYVHLSGHNLDGKKDEEDRFTWGASAADMAVIMMQRPVRLLISVQTLLADPTA